MTCHKYLNNNLNGNYKLQFLKVMNKVSFRKNNFCIKLFYNINYISNLFAIIIKLVIDKITL